MTVGRLMKVQADAVSLAIRNTDVIEPSEPKHAINDELNRRNPTPISSVSWFNYE